ncbi:hypothetical protein B0H14DRAFT_2934411 [Mycena olivaceomarginata]|nr:hypothetical protein B0H14DRAFT_2934411 [Mycena olivaceomarginata]
MASEDTSAAMVFGRHFTNACLLLTFTILCYDYLLTFEDEINFVWRKHKRLSFFLFIILRSVSLLSNTVMIVLRFGPAPLERCHESIGHVALLILQSVLVGSILELRVYAMYGFSRKVLLFLVIIGVTTVALAAWSISGDWVQATQTLGCQYPVSRPSAIRMAGAWRTVNQSRSLAPL